MRGAAAGMLLILFLGCAHGHTKVGASGVIGMKERGLSDAQIIGEVERKDVVLTLTDDDVVALVAAGFTQETINALLERARDVGSSGHHH